MGALVVPATFGPSGGASAPRASFRPPDALQAHLRQASFFRVLGESDLAAAVAVARCQIHCRGELVQGPDGVIRDFYVVLAGAVRCSLLSAEGNKVTLGTVHPGMVLWLEPEDTRAMATVCAEVLEDNTLLCRLPYQFVREIMKREPQFAVEVYDVLYAWCAAFRDRLIELAHDHVGARLAHLLGRLAETSATCTVMETHDELAWWIGASRARVTKELHCLRERGLIDYRPHIRGIQVHDPQKLSAFRG
jgi:CRP-like cAMP-binding protein